MSESSFDHDIDDTSIAIIGMAGRFPGARNLDTFWKNLVDGVESITRFSNEVLIDAGIDASTLSLSNYVKARGILTEIEFFDAHFFGLSPKEAALMDVQHRIFLQCAWHAVESAGYDPETFRGAFGVYAGCGMNTYFLWHLYPGANRMGPSAGYQLTIGNDKDFLSTLVSYKLNLHGPSVGIQTACSTSLVAVHTACQGLLSGECDMALAGGVSVEVPHVAGYFYEQGMILSPDGHCRAFDAQAQGTVPASGCGIVVLKRYKEAIDDGDHIHAVIRGSAVNNDGGRKVGFTAPAIDGQRQVIAEAMAVSGVKPESITYIEAHGTGTSLGDPIEFEALSQAFGKKEKAGKFCALGAVKTNLGHTGAAAGVAGLIKTVLAVENGKIPQTIHFETPNTKMDYDNSPFYINQRSVDWQPADQARRAGVSSFGLGGTNCHMILEQHFHEKTRQDNKADRAGHLLVVSAKTETALNALMTDLGTYLKRHPNLNIADVAFTLQVGRRPFQFRSAVVCKDAAEAAHALSNPQSKNMLKGQVKEGQRPVVFMFPGQGAQYAGMGRSLYLQEPVFRDTLDLCAQMFFDHAGFDVRDVLYFQIDHPDTDINHTSTAQVCIFCFEYALARMLMSWGVHPKAMIGHSIGEYTAACLAGVFSVQDAAKLVSKRARLMADMVPGAMLAVFYPHDRIRPLMTDALSMSAINGPSFCVVSGSHEAVRGFQERLQSRGISCRRLHVSHAFHSHMMQPAADRFIDAFDDIELRSPDIPYISNLTGDWISPQSVTDPDYFADHLVQTVQFNDGMKRILEDPMCVLLEIGPGRTLSTFVSDHAGSADHPCFSTVRHPENSFDDQVFLSVALGGLWTTGADIDWDCYHAGFNRYRVPLPAYPFERIRCWVDPEKAHLQQAHPKIDGRKPLSDWFYLPSWKRSVLPIHRTGTDPHDFYLVFCGHGSLEQELISKLCPNPKQVISVYPGKTYHRPEHYHFIIDPANRQHYAKLWSELCSGVTRPKHILHLWSIIFDPKAVPVNVPFSDALNHGFFSVLNLMHAIIRYGDVKPTRMTIVSSDQNHVTGNEKSVCPENAMLTAETIAIGQEFPQIRVKSIDVSRTDWNPEKGIRLLSQVLTEISADDFDTVVALRNGYRWVPCNEPLVMKESFKTGDLRFRKHGVYIIFGGLGRIGWQMTGILAEKFHAGLVLTGKSSFPERNRWDMILQTVPMDDPIHQKIVKIRQWESLGAHITVIQADLTSFDQMKSVVHQAKQTHGRINGVIHAAGVTSSDAFMPIEKIEPWDCHRQFGPKINGLYILNRLIRNEDLDFCLINSSLSSILGGLGYLVYSSANMFMDAFCAWQNQTCRFPWISINWDGWDFGEEKPAHPFYQSKAMNLSLTPVQGIEAFERIMSVPDIRQVIVSTGDLEHRIHRRILTESFSKSQQEHHAGQQNPSQRPDLPTPYVPPETEPEKIFVEILQDLLGLETVGIHDNFFDLGIHSLMATQVVSRIRSAFDMDVPLAMMFEHPTVSSLVDALARQRIETVGEEQLAAMLDMLEDMPDQEALKSLNSENKDNES